LASLIGAFLSPTFSSADERNIATVEIDLSRTVNEDIVGLGWNVGPLWIPSATSDLEEFFHLFKDSGQPWIRLVLQYYEWEGKKENGKFIPQNDDGDPWTSPADFLSESRDGFVWSADGQLDRNIVSVLDFCEENDIWVEVNNWETNKKPWIAQKYLDPKFYETPVKYEEYAKDADEFGENVAALVYYLKTTANDGKGYDCVKYYALWNEPGGGHGNHSFVQVDYPGCLNLLHKAVHEHLVYYDKEMGTDVRERVDSIGLESFPSWRNCPVAGHKGEGWDDLVGKGVITYAETPDGLPGEITNWPDGDPYMNIISVHEYWCAFDYDSNNPSGSKHGTIASRLIPAILENTIEQIQDCDIDDDIEPVFIGEIGTHVYGKGQRDGPDYDRSLFIAEAAIRALQLDGVKAVSRWGWNMHEAYAAVSYPGCWWELEPKGIVHAVNENYYPYTLLTRFIKRGSDVLSVKVSGGVDSSSAEQEYPMVEAQRVWCGAFRSPENKISVHVVNDSYESKALTLAFSGCYFEDARRFDHLFVTENKHEEIHSGVSHVIERDKMAITQEVPPRSISVFTEYE